MGNLFNKILIANRGEIAVRIIRACRELDISTVAVYSDADQTALHVRLADEAVLIGPSSVEASYLDQEKILQAAHQTGAQAIHPGYGFLSENADFAQAVKDKGLVFIGPSVEAIAAMGDKARARQRMQTAGVPVIPGYQDQDDFVSFQAAAEEIGYPVLVKAAAGGGGKGMRLVWEAGELASAMAAARREAQYAFGNGRLILEAYIPDAHHIEFQILGDQFGHLIHLYERECSIQRRHQKIIEETPSPLLDENLRTEMGLAAITAAVAIDYTNAGTIEFIVDSMRKTFYFLEMNTRLQVEHPITEMVTGIDIVQWQLKIAAGEQLPFSQSNIKQRGHAIECRLYAEDPENNFLPATGTLLRLIEPRGPGIRIDSGFTSGDEITVHYDPLIAKIITFAEDRPAAIYKMQSALRECVVLGLPTNWQILIDVLSTDEFLNGLTNTTWFEKHFEGWQAPRCSPPPEVLAAAALTQFKLDGRQSITPENPAMDQYSPWHMGNHFRIGEPK